MKSLSKVLVAGLFASVAATSFAQNLEGVPPEVIGLNAGQSTVSRADVQAQARQSVQAPAYLVTGDTFTPNTNVAVAHDHERARADVRNEARLAVRNERAPSFIGG